MILNIFQKPHIRLAQASWRDLVSSQDCLIDATCGNGNDTYFLTRLHPRKIYSIDVQMEALAKTKAALQTKLSPEEYNKIEFLEQCHSQFPVEVKAETVKLIVYNLGYLPGGDKRITTRVETTLASLHQAESLIVPGGCISITCYPGHAEGKREEEAILSYAEKLDRHAWTCCHHRWVNRPNSPSLLLIYRYVDLGRLS